MYKSILKKNTIPEYHNDSNENFENSIKQEITNLAKSYFAIFSSRKKLIFKHLRNEIRQNGYKIKEFAANMHLLKLKQN